ncbi:MAG: LysR family transcriptional regulator, partial [Mangrovicoccus sp.]
LRITTFPLMQEAVLHHLGIGIFLENSSHPSTAICGIPITEMPEIYDTCVVIPEDKTRLALVERFLALAL